MQIALRRLTLSTKERAPFPSRDGSAKASKADSSAMELSVPRRHIVWNGVDHATSTSERDPRSDDPRHFDRDALTPLASTAWMTDDVAVAPLDRAAIDRTALRRELRELKTHELVRRGRPA